MRTSLPHVQILFFFFFFFFFCCFFFFFFLGGGRGWLLFSFFFVSFSSSTKYCAAAATHISYHFLVCQRTAEHGQNHSRTISRFSSKIFFTFDFSTPIKLASLNDMTMRNR